MRAALDASNLEVFQELIQALPHGRRLEVLDFQMPANFGGGANPESSGENFCLLIMASWETKPEFVELLLSYGANPYIAGNSLKRMPALHYCFLPTPRW